MKKLFTLFLLAVISLSAWAQPGAMKFAGPSTFGVAEMNAWQDNASDTIVFSMNVQTMEADITLPALTYTDMGLTIPSFTIHGLKFAYDFTTRSATFEDQSYAETVEVDGAQKAITGYSFTAQYDGSAYAFTLQTVLSYGRMPVKVTYKLQATYVSPTTALSALEATGSDAPAFDLLGRQTDGAASGRILIRGGQKVLVR